MAGAQKEPQIAAIHRDYYPNAAKPDLVIDHLESGKIVVWVKPENHAKYKAMIDALTQVIDIAKG